MRPRSGDIRRTYIGALPGKIIQYPQKGKDPAIRSFCLDEVDKMSTDFQRETRPQPCWRSWTLNRIIAFNDHYLDLDYDLSDVFFHYNGQQSPQYPLTASGPDGDYSTSRVYRAGKVEYRQTVS